MPFYAPGQKNVFNASIMNISFAKFTLPFSTHTFLPQKYHFNFICKLLSLLIGFSFQLYTFIMQIICYMAIDTHPNTPDNFLL